MRKLLKWGGIALVLFMVLIAGAVVLVPMFVDVQRYKPEIEALVTNQTGRQFTMGDDIRLSFFPWVGVRLSDLALGNAQGFGKEEMVSVKAFEVRLKVLPLLLRKVQVDTFVVDSPQIRLVKNSAGKGNWENIGPAKSADQPPAAETETGANESAGGGLPVASLLVEKFSIANGMLSYADQASGMAREISDLNLTLTDISLDKPVTIDFSAMADGMPLSVSGTAGPIGKEPGKGDLHLDLAIRVLDTLALALKGRIIQPMGAQEVDLAMDLAPFSPREVFDRLKQPFPVETSDPNVLAKLSLKAGVKGSAKAVTLSDGMAVLDDSTLTFSVSAKDFEKPDIGFDLNLDTIDLDRYLPPPGKAGTSGPAAGQASPGKAARPDYTPLRKMVVDGKATVGNLKAANLRMENIVARITGKNGVFNLDPFSVDLYQGRAEAKARLDVRQNRPAARLNLNAGNIQAGPMITDAVQKNLIEGTLAADVALAMTGDTPDQIKKSLGGEGILTFTDGAVIGVDIAGTIRNLSSGLGLGEKTAQKPRTDFAELKIPYTADQGLVNIPNASLVSPLLRLAARGKTRLAEESLDFRVEPKLVATLKGQGDTKQRSGLLVPLVITGTYAAPKVRPDLKAMVGGQVPDAEGIKQMLKGKDGRGDSVEDKAKSLIKGLFN
ncbi:MAG: AsmA family protein [Desulfobacter sp.]